MRSDRSMVKLYPPVTLAIAMAKLVVIVANFHQNVPMDFCGTTSDQVRRYWERIFRRC